MKIKFAAVAMFFIAIIISDLNAQESTRVVEDVILFQSEAHLVRMTEKGKILAFIKDVDNNYAALNSITPQEIVMSAVEIASNPDLARSEKSRVSPEMMKESETAIANDSDRSDQESVVQMNETMEVDVRAEDEMDALIAESSGQPDEDMMAKGTEADKTKSYDYEFAFDHRDASLSPAVVNQLNQIADILKADESAKAEIKSYFSETVDISKVLSKNRAKGIQDQLVASGIDRSRIQISEANNEDWANNRVKLSIY